MATFSVIYDQMHDRFIADTPKSYKTYHDIFELENTTSAVMIVNLKNILLGPFFKNFFY